MLTCWGCGSSRCLLFSVCCGQQFFLAYIGLPLGALGALELLGLLLRRAVGAVAVRGGYIRDRRLFGIYDFVGLYLHFASGVALAALRLAFTYADFAVSFQRLDLPAVPGPLQHWDPGHASFMAMLYLDYVYNAPTTSVLAHCLAAAIRERRPAAAATPRPLDPKPAAPRPAETAADAVAAAEAAAAEAAAEAAEYDGIRRRQQVRWQFLYTQHNNPTALARRVYPPPPVQPWEVEDEPPAAGRNPVKQ